jgi:hypothetical protein
MAGETNMDAIVYLFYLAANYLVGLAHELYAWLWKTATTFTVLTISYVLFQILSILMKHLENEIETKAAETRLIIQGRLLTIEGRLSGIQDSNLTILRRDLTKSKLRRASQVPAVGISLPLTRSTHATAVTAGCAPFDPVSARTNRDGGEPRASYGPEQEDEDK